MFCFTSNTAQLYINQTNDNYLKIHVGLHGNIVLQVETFNSINNFVMIMYVVMYCNLMFSISTINKKQNSDFQRSISMEKVNTRDKSVDGNSFCMSLFIFEFHVQPNYIATCTICY